MYVLTHRLLTILTIAVMAMARMWLYRNKGALENWLYHLWLY